MNRILSVLLLGAITSGVAAGPDPLVGQFTHDFTRPENQPVWTVKKSGTGWRVLFHGANETMVAKQVNNAGKAAFWEQMWWPADKAKDAQCLSIEGKWQGMMCYVHRNARAGVSDLAQNGSDYFYYDPLGGLKEIRRTRR
jgi:hypothetical protein